MNLGEWRKMVAALNEDHCQRLADERAYTIEFVEWLRSKGLIGLHNGQFALPVFNGSVDPCAVHYAGAMGVGGIRRRVSQPRRLSSVISRTLLQSTSGKASGICLP